MHGHTSSIEDYALIGDARSAALVARTGSIDWLCWPRFDSPALFAALLDTDKGGHCRVAPVGPYRTTRAYEDSSNVLVTTYEAETGLAKLTDLFFATTEARKRGRLLPQAMVIRRIECMSGSMDIAVDVKPRPDFGKRKPLFRRLGDSSHTFSIGDGVVQILCDAPLENEDGSLRATVGLARGQATTLLLAFEGNEPAAIPDLRHAPHLIAETREYWQGWAQRITYRGVHEDTVIRSALVLKLLTFAPSGAMIAAPTTSLPEKIGAPYNWDYRFCWLRDASDTAYAFLELGMKEEANSFLQWLLHTTRLSHPRLQIMYGVLGKRGLPESELAWLSGYENSRPVRIGNAAHSQLQLDIYGEVLQAAALTYGEGAKLSGDERSFLRGLATFVLNNWQEPDSGIWETRGPPQHFVHSKVMCWRALQSTLDLVQRGLLEFDASVLRTAAEAVKQTVIERGFNGEIGSYAGALDGSELDASMLTLPIVGFEDARSPRMVATIETIRKELERDGLVLRHRREETGGEGAFLLCSFWLVQCLALQGRIGEAHSLFHRLCSKANDVGLFAEEIDRDNGRFLGNFPQAYTHIGLINAALALARSESVGPKARFQS